MKVLGFDPPGTMGITGAAAGWLKAAILSLNALLFGAIGGGFLFEAGAAGSAGVGFGAGGGSALTGGLLTLPAD